MDGPTIPSKSRLMYQGFEVQERGMGVVSNIEEDENKTDVTIWSPKGVTLQHKFHLCLAKPVINERCSLRSEES